MEGINRATLLGNLGADPELRFTQNGGAVLNFRICTNTRYKDRNDEWQDREEWHSIVVWGKRGEALEKLLSRGSSVLVEGEIRTSSYEKDGDKRYKTEIHANTVILTGGSKGGNGRRDDDDRRDRDRGRDDDRRDRGGDGRRRNAAEEMKRRADERHERARRGEDDDDRRATDDLPY